MVSRLEIGTLTQLSQGMGGCFRDHGMDTQDLEFKFFAKRVESSYVVTATYV